jgi:hypothetical protein
MTSLLVPIVAVTAGVLLAGCGASSAPRVDPDGAGKPSWGGCTERSSLIRDYLASAEGARTRAAAIAPYRQAGDHVVLRPAQEHRHAAWLLVDARNVIHTSLELTHGRHGWLVSMVERCSR